MGQTLMNDLASTRVFLSICTSSIRYIITKGIILYRTPLKFIPTDVLGQIISQNFIMEKMYQSFLDHSTRGFLHKG